MKISRDYLKSIIKECLNEIFNEEMDVTKNPKVAAANAIAAAAKVKVADEKNKYYTDQIRTASKEERITTEPNTKNNIRKKIKDLKDKQKAAKSEKQTANLEKSQANAAKSGK